MNPHVARMKTSIRGIELIKRFESFSAWPYRCPANVLSIGWGHTRGVEELTAPISIELGEELLLEDVADSEQGVRSMIGAYVPTQQQWDALVSFVFNLGAGPAVQTSRLFQALRACKPRTAAGEFINWVYVTKGKRKVPSPGLITRRQAERALFLEGTPT